MFEFFSSDAFMPHGHCYLWHPALLWIQVLSNGLIGVAYLAISVTLAYLVRKGQYLPFKGMAAAFGMFIVTCGMTHFLDVYVIWVPEYWLDGAVRMVTALCSIGTALLLPPLVPKAVALARGAKAARQRGIELEVLVEDLAQLVEKTKALDQLKTDFFASVSHELRTPLALILGPAEKLQDAGNLDAAQKQDVDIIARNARTLLKHVNDLLDLSRLEAGKLRPSYAPVDVVSLVRRTAGQFRGLADERNMDFRIEGEEHLVAEIDPDQIQRVVLNLLSNAFKFTGTLGRIRCAVFAAGDRAVIEVSDSGPGIPAAERGSIFERFRQLEGGSARRFGGTGLGLAIVKDFVDLHRGRIEVGDAPEGGARFRVDLPQRAPLGALVRTTDAPYEHALHDSMRQSIDELRAPQASLTAEILAGNVEERPTVLVVEDNPDMNRFIRDLLAADYRTIAAFDGREGYEKAVAAKPDLVISDVMMPEVSGDQLVAKLKANDALAHTPVLLLTAKTDDEMRVRMLNEGARDYLTKPFSADELRARVHNLVAMKRTLDVLQTDVDTKTHDIEALASEVTQRNRELETSLDQMRVARERAEHASELKTNFLSMVSHELRTPLATLQVQIERLRVEQESAPIAGDVVERLRRSAERLRALIDELLSYARLQSGRMELDVESFDVAALVDRVLEPLRPRAAAKGITLEVTRPEPLPPLRSDQRLLRLVLGHLLENAIKFTERGAVHLGVTTAGRSWTFEVRDTGPGIASEDHMRIFEPFEALEATRKKHAVGVGLGLTLVREVVTALGGTIAVDSARGSGATFRVTLSSLPDEVQHVGGGGG